jgi:uncharacterized cofD-like protein
MSFYKWLYPGMHVKRWIALLAIGITFISLGIAYLMVQIYREQPFPDFVAIVTLQFVDRPLRGALFIILGLIVGGVALMRMNQSLVSWFIPAGTEDNLVDLINQRRQLRHGPRIVAIGGGTGLSTLLRGLKEHSDNITAIVTVADDGGSSGRLRRELGVLPPGDFRPFIVALADVEPLMTKLFQYRFGEGSGLEGHSFGNLYIAAMTAITGNFEKAIRESSRVLAVTGQILPSTLADVTLCAEFDDRVVSGESAIPKTRKPIKRIFLKPDHIPGHPEAVRAILQADLIVIGPGSLFTSVLPNLLVPDIAQALRASGAVRVYVCNVCTQEGETEGYKVEDHLRVLSEHLGTQVFDYVLANDNFATTAELPVGVQMVKVGAETGVDFPGEVIAVDVVDDRQPLRHDPQKLAQNIIQLFLAKVQSHNGKKPSLMRTVNGVRDQLR